jgi:exosortase/archaeosortase family protein
VFRTRLASTLLLLFAEVGALTQFAEFSRGGMAYVADGRVCSGLLFSLTVLALLLARHGTADACNTVRPVGLRGWYLSVHLAGYFLFFGWTLELARWAAQGSVAAAAAVGWGLAAAAVGITALLSFFRLDELRDWVKACRTRFLLALGCGALLVLAGPWVQALWGSVCGPALAINRVLLERTYGEALTGTTTEGLPVVGTRKLVLFVTPQCSGLEGLAAFWLLAGAAFWTDAGAVRPVRIAVVVLLGTTALYLLNALRLYGLVVLGTQGSAKAAVGLAHSRLSELFFWGVALILLVGTSRWRCGASPCGSRRAHAGLPRLSPRPDPAADRVGRPW